MKTQSIIPITAIAKYFNINICNNSKVVPIQLFVDTIIYEIKNLNTFTDTQLTQFETLSESEKLQVIRTYNFMFAYIKEIL